MGEKAMGPKPLAVIAFERAGYIEATHAMVWLIEWGIAMEALGEQPNVAQVAVWWRHSVAKGFRLQRAWRKCFPDLEVSAVWAFARTRVTSRSKAAALEVGGCVLPRMA